MGSEERLLEDNDSGDVPLSDWQSCEGSDWSSRCRRALHTLAEKLDAARHILAIVALVYIVFTAAYGLSHVLRGAQPRERDGAATSTQIDHFADFRGRDQCNISSTELHDAFSPVCTDKQSLLTSMSNGGRHGFDKPYHTGSCDMRWFTTSEICEIMSRFDSVHLIGDSLIRHVTVAMHMILRSDLNGGGAAPWKDDAAHVCMCERAFQVKLNSNPQECRFNTALGTADVKLHDPDSLKCGVDSTPIQFTSMLAAPLPDERLEHLTSRVHLSSTMPGKPKALIFSHGPWNGMDLGMTQNWTMSIDDALRRSAPSMYIGDVAQYPRLFVSLNAVAENLLEQYVAKTNNVLVAKFVHALMPWLEEQKYDHLGTFNLTVQATSNDGGHANMRSNLIKAMMVFNWLDSIDVSQY